MSASKRGSLPLGLLLSLAFAACGGNDATIGGIDDPSSSANRDITSSTSSTCAATQLRATYALGGTILAAWGTVDGYVLVKDESIVGVVTDKAAIPCGAAVVETGGVIAPGLVDLHNHVAYDFIGTWTPPRKYQNRYQWASDPSYAAAVKTPYNAVKGKGHLCEAQKLGELRALMGGTTTIQGSIGYSCENGWVRNVEEHNFCQDTVRQNVLPVSSITASDAAKLIAQFDSGVTKSYLVHLAEGVDDASRAEWETLRGLGLLRKEVIAIHGTALTADQLNEMGQIGMRLVWSPSSNLALYGATTDVPTALKAGVKVALAPDWTPSGSDNLLGELKVADRLNQQQWGGLLSDEQLLQMATSVPAEMVGFGNKLGRIAPGFAADLVVVRNPAQKAAARAVIDAAPQDVLLTVVAGQAMYGDPGFLGTLGVTGFDGLTLCDGESRGLLVKDATVTSGGNESLADVVGTLTADASSIYPLGGNCPAQLQTNAPPAP